MGQILVVDDDTDLCQLMVRLFSRLGHLASCETSGAAALARLESDVPDVILLDIMMPDMNGIDVLRRLRGDSRTKSIPVVMFSALSDPEVKNNALHLGANDFWVKASVDFSQITERLAAFFPKQ